MEKEIEMDFEKETKNTVRYDANPEGEPPACKNVYVQKWALPSPVPESVTVTLEFPEE